MPEQERAAEAPPEILRIELTSRALTVYRKILDAIVTSLVFVMVLTLIGAVAGLVLDFVAAADSFRTAVSGHSPTHGVVDGIDRELVIDVLSVFVLMNCFAPSRSIWSSTASASGYSLRLALRLFCGKSSSACTTAAWIGIRSWRSPLCWPSW